VLETRFIRQNVELVEASLRKRGQAYDLRDFLDCDAKRRAILLEAEELKHERNTVSGRIAQMDKDQPKASELIAEMREVSQRIKALDEELSEHEQTLHAILMGLPNLPHDSVPTGKDSEDNVVINLRFADGSVGSIGYFGEGSKMMPKEHLEIVGLGRSAAIENFQKVILYSERRKVQKRCSGKGHSEEIDAFLEGVQNGRLPIPMESLLATSLTTFGIRRSLTSGRAEAIATSKLLSTP